MKGKTVLSTLLTVIMVLTIAMSAVATTDGGEVTAFATTTCDSCSDCTKKLDGKYGTVVLTADLIDVKGSGITFGADNVVFDGGGHIIDGDNSGEFESGITMTGKSGNTIQNCVITDFESGITLYGSSKNEIYENEIRSNYYDGIWISEESNSNNIHDNVIEDNGEYGVFFSSNSDGNTFSENTVCSNPTDIHDSAKNSGDDNVCDTTDNWNDAGTTGCTRDCASRKPDLVITDISNDDGTICYEIKNIGDATASEGHRTTLFVDGLYQIKEQVDVDLAPVASVERCFDYYTWNCTSPADTVEVCADYGDFVDESDEENNCLNVTWGCTSPASPGDAIIYHADYGAGIWRIESDGSENTQLSDHGWFAEYSPDNAKIAFGEYYQNGIWVMDADGTGQVQSTSSGNAPTWSPDGARIAYHVGGTTVTERRIWVMDADGSNAHKLSDNPGDFPAWSPDGTKIAYYGEVDKDIRLMNPDGTGDTQLCAEGAFPAWSPDGRKIAYRYGCIWTMNADGSDNVKMSTNAGKHPAWSSDGTKIAYEGTTGIWVIGADGTDEHLINQGGHAPDWMSPGIVGELPDLVITDVWEGDDGGICYQIRNIGEATAPTGHHSVLLIDGIEVAGDSIGVELEPGERLKRCFNYGWQCSPAADVITVCADHKDVVYEASEGNNCRNETWKCDNTPPVIVSGPVVSESTSSSVAISWTTDEYGDSVARFGRTAGKYEDQKSGMKMKQEHKIVLEDLLPSTTYHYVVESTDASENTVVSRDGIFETGPVPDDEPPVVHSLDITRGKGDFLYYELFADVSDNIGVERVEFYMDDTLIGTDYSEPYQCYMDPASIGMMREELFTDEHTIEAVAIDECRVEVRLPELFDPPYECEHIGMEMRHPHSDYTIYIEGDTVPAGTIVPIEVYAAVEQESCSCVSWTRDAYGWDRCDRFSCWTMLFPISKVEFYVNRAPIPNTSSGYIYTGNWDVSGFPLGTHVIKVDAIASEGCKQTIIRDVSVVRGEPSLDVKREVTRTGNCFRVELTVENHGTLSAQFDRIEDNVDGFQPIDKSTAEYDVITECSDDGRHCDIEIDLPGSSFTLEPGEHIRMEYPAVPIEYPGPGTPLHAIGADPVRVMDRWGIDPHSFDIPCILTSDDHTLPYGLDAAIETSDYLIVTNPDRLFDRFSRADADSVLSAMADLAQTRRGILGYPSGPASDDPIWVSDCIRMWGSVMRGSEGTDNNYLSNGYLLIVGETEIIPSWTVDISDMHWSDDRTTTEVPFSDLPYADVLGNDGVPELITGRIIGNAASDLIRPIEASIEVAGGTGFDRSFGMVTSGSEGEWEDFVPSACNVQVVLHDQMSEGASALHWSRWVHKDETSMVMGYHLPITSNDGFLLADVDGDGASEAVVVDDSTNLASVYEYSDLGWELSTASDSFQCRFTPYDGLAAGDIDSDGENEIIVGTDEWDEIAIFNDFPRHTSGNDQFPEFSVDFDPWDVIASGDLWGDGEDEIILASTDDYGTIYIYSYYVPESGGPYPELRLRDTLEYVSFTAYDGFAVGNVAGDAKDEIIVANDVTDRIYIYNAVGAKIGELEADPFTHYDGLAVGDVDGDGMDEIAIIIDDEIDEKRRLFVYEDGSWYYDAAEEEWKIRRGGVHKIYSRYIDFHGIRYTASDTRHDGFAIGDIHGDGAAEIGVALTGGDKLYILDGHYPDGWKDRYMPVIRGDAPDIDIFTMRGHGNPTACSPFDTWDIASFDFSAHPLVLALTCLSGNYEGDWWWLKSGSPDIHTDGDNGFAEALFDSGAAVYIGATHVSSSSHNNPAGPAFFEEWGAYETAGEAFTQYERDRAGTGDGGWQYWVTEYNYYGDPKFGTVDGYRGTATMAHATKEDELPLSSLKVSIPKYEVNTTAGEDYVNIPGGDILLEDGKPRVPYYTVKMDFPVGYKIQDIELVAKSDLSTTDGFNLPTTVMMLDSLENGLFAEAKTDGEEWYPTEDFDWRVIPNGDGSSTLVLMVYPFYYNQLTTGVRFYQDYSFEINYTKSAVEIVTLRTDKDAYQQGDDILVNLWLNNSGDAQDVLVDAVVKSRGSGEVISGLLLRTLKDFAGLASFSPQWDGDGFEPGYYFVEVTLKDTSGNVLDRKTEMFRLGISSGEIASFTAAPECFDIGDEIGIAMAFENNGTVNITGTAIIRVLNSTGGTAYEFRHNVTNLTPSESVSFSDAWDTSGAEAGSYYTIIGYVLYDSRSTDPATVTVRNMVMGDLNGDGEITPADVGIALELAARGEYDPAADVDYDGQATALDALMIAQAAAGNIELEGCETR